MTLPGILFGILISILLGAVFHLWKDGGFMKLLFYIGLSVVGFWGRSHPGELSALVFLVLGSVKIWNGLVWLYCFPLPGILAFSHPNRKELIIVCDYLNWRNLPCFA